MQPSVAPWRLPLIVAAALCHAGAAHGQAPATSSTPFAITDNSFLVEEAFNQERGIVQSIFTLHHRGTDWEAAFTQEWPLRGQRHQFSYTVPYLGATVAHGLGDALVTYRLQASTETGTRAAISPRVSLLLPTGSLRKRLGTGRLGWQLNLPVSKQFGDYYVHANAGLTHTADDVSRYLMPHAAASVIWRTWPMLHLMMEVVSEWPRVDAAHRSVVTMAPGIRGGWTVRDAQLVLGLAAPFERTAGRADASIIGYLSYEMPFTRATP